MCNGPTWEWSFRRDTALTIHKLYETKLKWWLWGKVFFQEYNCVTCWLECHPQRATWKKGTVDKGWGLVLTGWLIHLLSARCDCLASFRLYLCVCVFVVLQSCRYSKWWHVLKCRETPDHRVSWMRGSGRQNYWQAWLCWVKVLWWLTLKRQMPFFDCVNNTSEGGIMGQMLSFSRFVLDLMNRV